MIKLFVGQLTVEGVDISGEEPPSILELAEDEEARATSPLRYQLRAALVNNGVLVNGRAEISLECRCGRCTTLFPLTVTNNEVCHFFEGHNLVELDLTDDIREDILINLPHYFTCSAHCKGLCFKCGKNLNVEDCGCAGGESTVTPWSELDKLDI